ncbi:enoyl-CoA hydratase/isomerase family protein [Halorubrum trueperi]|uniref:Enoyl-CoA hydratase/isomerase family protein n=1 Tax=Halorubrum trueperi TaxID=2004704 RepID=A0ABD5ULN7_9EURY
MTNKVTTEVDGNIGIITLNRPENNNTINVEMLEDLNSGLEELKMNDAVKSLILRGADNTFCAGADLLAFQDGELLTATSDIGLLRQVQKKLEDFPMPTIAAIEGVALGGGVELAACCDFRIADSDAELGFTEIDLGVFPGAGGTQRVPRLIGVTKSKELIFTGGRLSGIEAESIGLVDKVAGEDELMEVVIEFAEQFSDKPPIALQTAKAALNEVWRGSSLREGLLFESLAADIAFETEDRSEGMNAFLAKREPEWKGR